MTYIGRFAPSPSGRLHFGSLVAAVASFLRARSQGGRILLRIEDLDSFRCRSEYTKQIIYELDTLGFVYDEKPYIQSEHKDVYLKEASLLVDRNLAYYCRCTRSEKRTSRCACRSLGLTAQSEHVSLRYPLTSKVTDSFSDVIKGMVRSQPKDDNLTLIRADGIVSYNLACVVDDIRQNITEVVRGSDLIDITTSQISLFEAFSHKAPSYLHVPLAMEDETRKLSKQNHARAVLDMAPPSALIIGALRFLGQDVSNCSETDSPKVILSKATDSFDIEKIPLISMRTEFF
ncbi:MAG: tRNA glutamyl-Q(34) synthetase GluQRS [Succinivibrio sp.]